ncbi:MAG: UDP-3-O-(3-hydroxymyristoyl)glucosamine N-acyltransferase, partial [Verrucomicrobia bacterium]|nr:UDP-3-O-(3-hydroxymyristoyl)glucosamine N-acyltransferase [Verrucomicrobiota bacterium]
PLKEARSGELSFMVGSKYLKDLQQTKASFVLVPKDTQQQPAEGQVFIAVDNPSVALARFCSLVERELFPAPEPGIHPSAVIDASAKIGNNVHIGPFCVVGPNVTIGDRAALISHVFVGAHCSIGADCRLYHRVTLESYTELGRSCVLHAGVVFGR